MGYVPYKALDYNGNTRFGKYDASVYIFSQELIAKFR